MEKNIKKIYIGIEFRQFFISLLNLKRSEIFKSNLKSKNPTYKIKNSIYLIRFFVESVKYDTSN